VTTLMICPAVCALTTLAALLDAACSAATGMKAGFGVTSIDSITLGDGQSGRTRTVPPICPILRSVTREVDGRRERMFWSMETGADRGNPLR
jgi:hypothetical protein